MNTKNRQSVPFTPYDTIMLTYLVASSVILPMIIGELLVEMELIGSIHESELPEFILNLVYMYEVLLLFSLGLGAFIIWIPALLISIKYWREWRIVVPAVLLILAEVSLFFTDNTVKVDALTIFGTASVLAALLIGIEWLWKRYSR